MEQETRIFINVWITILTSLCYSYYIPSKLPKGKPRLLSLLPICTLFTILPLSLSTVLPTGITAFFITWLANFKLFLFAFDEGPLYSNPPRSLLLFILLACLPIKTKQNEPYPNPKNNSLNKPTPILPLNLPIKIFLLGILLFVRDLEDRLQGIVNANVEVVRCLILGLYSCMLYLFVDIILGVSNNLARWVLGIELEPPSDEPYLSTSLQDFWGRRWNLIVTNTLRHTVYKPLRMFLELNYGIKWAPLPAVLATFLVSGLMHELLFYYMTRVAPTWEVTMYFVLHGLCVVVEFGVKATLGERWRLHRAVSGPLTVAFVVVTAMWLFYPQLVNSGVDVRAIQECKTLVGFFKLK